VKGKEGKGRCSYQGGGRDARVSERESRPGGEGRNMEVFGDSEEDTAGSKDASLCRGKDRHRKTYAKRMSYLPTRTAGKLTIQKGERRYCRLLSEKKATRPLHAGERESTGQEVDQRPPIGKETSLERKGPRASQRPCGRGGEKAGRPGFKRVNSRC